MLPESSPSQTCFRTPHCASLLWTHWVIPGAPGWLSHFFQQISQRLSDICTHTHAAQVSSPHIWLYKQSGQSCPLMFINWVCSLDLNVAPLWVKTAPRAAEEHWAVMKLRRQQCGLVLSTSTAVRGSLFSDVSFYTSTAQLKVPRSCLHCHSAALAFGSCTIITRNKSFLRKLSKSLSH